MPSRHKDRHYDHYKKKLKRSVDPIPCPMCDVSVLQTEFEKHCSDQHEIDISTLCVWCRSFSWPHRTKTQHGPHLLECYEIFIEEIRRPCLSPSPSSPLPSASFQDVPPSSSSPPLPSTSFRGDPPPSWSPASADPFLLPSTSSSSTATPTIAPPPTFVPRKLLNMKHLYAEKTLFDLDSLPNISSHDSLWPLDVELPPPLSYPDDSLNLALCYLQKYFELRNTHDWFHVMVKAVALDTFVCALDEDEGRTRTLLFSCWCNGGPYEEARHRQHRHLVAVSPKNHFKDNVWNKVAVAKEDKPAPYFPCKLFSKIESPLHLLNTLGYVSHRKSQCHFTVRQAKNTPVKLHHFYLFKTLPVDFQLPLALSFQGGLEELLNQEKFKNVLIRKLTESPLHRVGSQWRQKIKDFYGHERGIVVPVSREFLPCEDPTPACFHLLGGKRLHFQSSPENESTDADLWIRKQAEGGNCFYDNVEEETWTPRRHDQALLTDFKPVVDRKRKLEKTGREREAKLKETEEKCRAWEEKYKECEEQRRKCEAEYQESEEKCQAWKKRYKESEEENESKRLKIEEQQAEIDRLNSENDQLKRKDAERCREMEQLEREKWNNSREKKTWNDHQ